MRIKNLLILSFFATLLAVFWQEINLYFIGNNFPVVNGLITCADEYSYLQPANNFLETGQWTAGGSSGMIGYFMRPPGMGIYYLFLKIIFGTKVWFAMKICQIIFVFLSILIFSKILELRKISAKFNFIFTILFALIPCYNGFMYFTITESISPVFVLLSTYFWLKIDKENKKFTYYYILCAAFLILIRPQLLIFPLLFSLFIFLKINRKMAYYSLLAFLPFLLWNARTISIAGKWMGIHPIYSELNNSLYRPSHEKMTNLFRIWEYQGDVFHTCVGKLATDSSSLARKEVLTRIPSKFHSEVEPIFKSYQKLEFLRNSMYKRGDVIRKALPGETFFLQEIEKTTSNLIKVNFLDYYLITPSKSLQKLIISSHLNLRIFQEELRGTFFGEFLRWSCLLLLVTSYILTFLYLFRKKVDPLKILSIGIVISFFYLSFVQRMNEERYITPILPLCLLLAAGFFINTKNGGKDNESEKSF